jgi:hypothetical protein
MLSKILKSTNVIILTVVLFGSAIFVVYSFNDQYRDVIYSPADFQMDSKKLVREYLNDPMRADERYLDEEGDSKIIEVHGTVNEIVEDYNQQKVVVLKDIKDKVGVSCTFLKKTQDKLNQIKIGDKVKIKGIIRSGALYDKDLAMYEHVILEKCSLSNY